MGQHIIQRVKSIIPWIVWNKGFIIIYDICDKASFDSAGFYIEVIRKYVSRDALIILVESKIDLDDKRVVSEQDGFDLAQSAKVMFRSTSACTGEGVEELFNTLIEIVVLKEMYLSHFRIKNSSDENDKDLGCWF